MIPLKDCKFKIASRIPLGGILIGAVAISIGFTNCTALKPMPISNNISNSFQGSVVTPTITIPPPSANLVPPIPQLAIWESRMKSGGTQFCVKADIDKMIGSWGIYDDPSTNFTEGEGSVWYYDGNKVYMQIAKYTGDSSWYTCAKYVEADYMAWVNAMWGGATWAVGKLNGWRIFPHGFLHDYKRTGNIQARDALVTLSKYSAFAESGGGPTCDLSRETAYILNTYLAAEDAGEPRNPRVSTAVDFALSHIDQWFGSKTCTANNQPFMVGLTMDALIYYWEKTADPRVPPAIALAVDGLWDRAWVPADKAFSADFSGTNGLPDVDLLIAPAYAWMWQRTGDSKYLDRGDQAFAGGVLGANFWSGKQFSQNFRWSFSFVKWRSSAPGSIKPLVGFEY